MSACPCGSLKDYTSCCDIFINGTQKPRTPEQLMRSRYTAYTLANIDYIVKTMKGPAAKGFDPQEATLWAQQSIWLGLTVLRSKTKKNRGFVEFIARYADPQGSQHALQELSEFKYEAGQWYYVDGKHRRVD